MHSVEIAEATGHHEYVTRGLYNLVEGLWRLGRHEDAIGYGDRAVAYARDRDFQIQMYFFAARRYRLLALRGRWGEAEAGIRALLDGQGDPGMPARETVPVLARILVRRGGEDARRRAGAGRGAQQPGRQPSSGSSRRRSATSSTRG